MEVLLVPTKNTLINTFIRSLVVIATMILGFKSSWYSAYWGAVIHDAISLTLLWHLKLV